MSESSLDIIEKRTTSCWASLPGPKKDRVNAILAVAFAILGGAGLALTLLSPHLDPTAWSWIQGGSLASLAIAAWRLSALVDRMDESCGFKRRHLLLLKTLIAAFPAIFGLYAMGWDFHHQGPTPFLLDAIHFLYFLGGGFIALWNLGLSCAPLSKKQESLTIENLTVGPNE